MAGRKPSECEKLCFHFYIFKLKTYWIVLSSQISLILLENWLDTEHYILG